MLKEPKRIIAEEPIAQEYSVVTKTAAAAFHDKLILFVCCASLRFHTGNLHSYSKTLAFIVSSADTVVKCWHLSSIIMANFVMILNPP